MKKLVLLLAVMSFAASDSAVSMKIRPTIMLSMSDIEVQVRVKPDSSNRILTLTWQSDVGAGQSLRQLEDDAPVLHTFRMRDQLPANYYFVASVYNVKGKLVNQATAEIHKPDAGDR